MKKELAVMFKFVVGFACIVLALGSCTNDINDLGKDLLDESDLVTVRKWVSEKGMIKAYTMSDEKQRTDEPPFNLLGHFNDPIFGKSTANYACQLRLNTFPKFKANDIIDSIVYYIAYKEIYGDLITAQKLKVYELASDLIYDNKYYQDIDLKGLAKSEVLAELNYIPKFKDTLRSSTSTIKDTVSQEIALHLNHSLARKLMATDSVTLSDNEKFIKHFKGLYIEAGDLASGGTIMKTTGSGMILYFRKENDTTKYKQTFYVTKNAANVSQFKHDYSTTKFAANLDKQTVQDSLIYLQTTGGLRTKVLIPDLGNWSDSTNFAINKAELVFQVDSTITDLKKLLPPEQLVFSAIGVDKDGNPTKYFPSDFLFSQAYYGGTYNSDDKTYRFNIAKHLQEVIDKKAGKENYGFYLETAFRAASFRRVVLKGATSKTGIRLEITYSKIN